MGKGFRFLVLFILVLSAVLPLSACAEAGWTEAACIEKWYEARYDLSAPAYCSGSHEDWRMYYQYASDPGDPCAMLLNWKIVDAQGDVPDVEPGTFHMIYLPYPQGHDAAMGYEYAVTVEGSGQAIAREPVDQAIAFSPVQGQASGTYRLSWGNGMNPRAAAWELIMSRMDWNGSSCSYTVGAGSRQVSVERRGRSVTFSGGEIAGPVRFANRTMWGDDYEAEQGWHTESGSYTFRNTTLLDDIYIWAHNGEDYTVTLDASVKGNYCILGNLEKGANLKLINNDIIQSDNWYSVDLGVASDCSLTITGNGKILEGHGEYWSEEKQRDIPDSAPIAVSIRVAAQTNEEALQCIKAFEGRVVVSYDQVQVSEGYPQIRSVCTYMPDPDNPYLAEEVTDPATGKPYKLDTEYVVKKLRPAGGAMTEPLLASTAELGEGALYRPLLVAAENDRFYLRSEMTAEVTDSSIEYEIHLVDADDEQVALSGKSRLYIPYPEGMDRTSAAGYEVTIRHRAADGEEIFSTADGTVELTPYGFCIAVSSLSPFEVSWGLPGTAADLPRTGDASRPELWGGVLALALASMVILVRRGKGHRSVYR